MEHEYNQEAEVFNRGWAHMDGKNPKIITADDYKLILCGQIQMTKHPDTETGVKINKLKDNVNWTQQELFNRTVNEYTLPREKLTKGEIDLKGFEQLYDEYHSHFDLTCTVANVYNRMISWKGGTIHGQKMTQQQGKRVNQYWFLQRM
jgi:hypothetical protein